ncbi:MAG: L-histidine N(alpha)-methyltransferase [Saprospirales bacterium]|nr:MAG: L-histidine N(alpha)-methyltransferase [Saprospirales bacterium]
MAEVTTEDPLAKAVVEGFSKEPKSVPSWALYDQKGDQLFRQIMELPEYYLTDCEAEIFKESAGEMLRIFSWDVERFNLVELGAGDGVKTEILLRQWMEMGGHLTYIPVDISPHILDILKERMRRNIPNLDIHTIPLDFNKALEGPIQELNQDRKVFFFLGSNIGNLRREEAVAFLKKVKSKMRKGDMALVGFDLRKDPRVVQRAYDDSKGITAEFNLNLLDRLNRELGADFDKRYFSHYPLYDPVSGTAKSYIVSRREQEVHFKKLNKKYAFQAWELIHTEISQKFNPTEIKDLASEAGMEVVNHFQDRKRYYRNVLLM